MASEEPADTADLVQEILAGDRQAEARLVERYSPALSYLLRRLTGDRALADDLHQETFRIVLERIRTGGVREPEKLAGFIRGTAKNLWTADYRKVRRRGPTEEVVDEPPDPAPSALSRVLREEDRRRVRRLLDELRLERDREILLRFHIAEQSKEEVCEALGIAPGQFNVTLFRARQRFRELLEKTIVGKDDAR
jgi:RNA polymerase sigma-70 factor (ECF subfamily)